MQFTSKHIWITSEEAPWQWYENPGGLSRRLLDCTGDNGGCYKLSFVDGVRTLGEKGEGVAHP